MSSLASFISGVISGLEDSRRFFLEHFNEIGPFFGFLEGFKMI